MKKALLLLGLIGCIPPPMVETPVVVEIEAAGRPAPIFESPTRKLTWLVGCNNPILEIGGVEAQRTDNEIWYKNTYSSTLIHIEIKGNELEVDCSEGLQVTYRCIKDIPQSHFICSNIELSIGCEFEKETTKGE